MATNLGTLVTRVRQQLLEKKRSATQRLFWTDEELLEHLIDGAKDMWGAILDLHQEHFLTIVDEDSTTPVTQAADATELSNVPEDVFRVHMLEPSDTTSNGTHRNVVYVPRDYNSAEFQRARALTSQDPNQNQIIYFTLLNAGHPVAAPTIAVAPKLSSTLTVRLAYVPGVGTLTENSDNPIPGESDKALVAYALAFARVKEREDRSPDPNWLAIYSTEKQSILVRLTPRQTQEPEIVPAFFEDAW